LNYAFLSVSFFEGFKENIRGKGRNFRKEISGNKCQENFEEFFHPEKRLSFQGFYSKKFHNT
jgi:hypothetical protein